MKDRPTSRHLLQDQLGRLVGWQHAENRVRIISRKNRRGYHEIAFSGIYILDPSVFELFPPEDVFSLTPWIIELSGVHDFRVWDQEGNYWYDLGTAENLERAERILHSEGDEINIR